MFSKISRAVEEVERVGKKLGMKPDLAHVKDKLETKTFSLVVLGQFKRGKTTFINALLGRELLPSAVVPLTAVPTILRYGEKVKVKVLFKDEAEKEISIEEINLYVTEKENPRNEKNVKDVVVHCPVEFLKEVQIVDTPGVGSVHRHNTQVALKYLPKCDVAVFLLSADQPLSEYEHDFLQEVKKHSEKTFFLLNKVDHLESAELEESLEFTGKVLQGDLESRVKVYPISAKLALEGRLNGNSSKVERSMIQDFEDALQSFLKREKEDVILTSSTRQVLGAASGIISSIELERKALLTPISELEDKLERFNDYLKEVDKRKDYVLFLFTREVEVALRRMEEELQDLYEEQVPRLQKEVEAFYKDNSHLQGGRLKEELNGFVEKTITNLFEDWIEEEGRKVESKFRTALEVAEEEIDGIVADIQRTSSDIFEVELQDIGQGELLTPEVRFSFLFNYPVTTLKLAESLFLSMMPGFISHRLILRGIKEEVTELVDRHCGRAREDFTRRNRESEREQKQQLEERIANVVEGINSAIKRARDMKERSKEEGEKHLAVLEELKERLEDAIQGLEA